MSRLSRNTACYRFSAPFAHKHWFLSVVAKQSSPDLDVSVQCISKLTPILITFLNLTSSTDRDDTARRRKMAKLERTLGANVPTELVFPPENLDGRRYRRLTARTVKAELGESLSRRQSSMSRASGRKYREVPTDSISHGWVWVGKREDIPSEIRERRQRTRVDSGVSFDWGRRRDLVEDEDIPATKASAGGMNRRESAWSGEWAGSVSVRNMEDVLRRLRGLKV
ncbi:hypothetical protein DFH06DRAFT_1387647 [Mycena polygramma]|nr:hypothetical protein DFH06DRAFT_1387647 [Mycena polygramma]